MEQLYQRSMERDWSPMVDLLRQVQSEAFTYAATVKVQPSLAAARASIIADQAFTTLSKRIMELEICDRDVATMFLTGAKLELEALNGAFQTEIVSLLLARAR